MDEEVGDSVFCGTINRFGAIDMETLILVRIALYKSLFEWFKMQKIDKPQFSIIADKWATWLVQ